MARSPTLLLDLILPTQMGDPFRFDKARKPLQVLQSSHLDRLVGVEGPGWMLPDLDAWLEDPRRRSKLLSAIGRVEAEPSLLGASAHLIVVGRRE